MSTVTTKYVRSVTKIGSCTAEWDSETNKVSFSIERKLSNGFVLKTDEFTLQDDELAGMTTVLNTVMAAILEANNEA